MALDDILRQPSGRLMPGNSLSLIVSRWNTEGGHDGVHMNDQLTRGATNHRYGMRVVPRRVWTEFGRLSMRRATYEPTRS